MTVGIGLIAPPVGLNVYVVNSIARDVPMNETYKGVFPFLAWDVLRGDAAAAVPGAEPGPGALVVRLTEGGP